MMIDLGITSKIDPQKMGLEMLDVLFVPRPLRTSSSKSKEPKMGIVGHSIVTEKGKLEEGATWATDKEQDMELEVSSKEDQATGGPISGQMEGVKTEVPRRRRLLKESNVNLPSSHLKKYMFEQYSVVFFALFPFKKYLCFELLA